MKTEQKVMDPQLLLEEYRQLLEDETVETLPLIISGSSMSPFVIHGRDTVYLSRITRPLKIGDAVLYRRDNGSYVLHRICQVRGESFTMIGDAQIVREPGIRRDQIFAIVTRVERKGKLLAPGCFWWDFFEKAWIRIVPLRRVLHRAYTLLHPGHRDQ